MKLLMTKALLAIGSLLIAQAALAEPAVVQLSTLDGTNVPENSAVQGVRFPLLHGKTNSVKGVDLHLIAIGETDDFVGVQFPLLIAGANHVNNSMTGVSFGLWNWNKGEAKGVHFGAVNVTNNVHGANIGMVNYSTGHTAFDWSAVNLSESSTVQLGFFNNTKQIKGVQIGLLNCAENGFFRCFPIVNFAKSKK